jgi:hypothetical protein
MLHTLAYSGDVPAGSSTEGLIAAVTDFVMATAGAQGFSVPSQLKVIAAWAGSADLNQARLVAPSLLRVSLPHIRPATAAALPGSDPNFSVLFDSPLLIKDNETLSISAQHGNGSAQRVRALVWLADEIEPAPKGSGFWVRYSSSTTVTADRWHLLTLNMDQLPEGQYAVTGFENFSTTCVAARLVFPNRPFRPGTLGLSGSSAAGERTHAAFYDGRFGVLGKFAAFTPPGVEVLCTGTDDHHDGYLRLVKL